MSPPLRPKGNEDALWHGLRQDDLALVSTDHCPFCMKEQKELGKDNFAKIPNGAPGIEQRMGLLWDGGVRPGRIDINRYVQITSTAAAKIFGLYPRKGTLAPGSDADVVIFDPDKEVRWSAKTHHMRVDYNPYEGRVTRGAPSHVFSRGTLIVENDQWLGKAGHGKFVKRGSLHTV
jgi:dihydropyrimidinase